LLIDFANTGSSPRICAAQSIGPMAFAVGPFFGDNPGTGTSPVGQIQTIANQSKSDWGRTLPKVEM
jgi:hypothetical protein